MYSGILFIPSGFFEKDGFRKRFGKCNTTRVAQASHVVELRYPWAGVSHKHSQMWDWGRWFTRGKRWIIKRRGQSGRASQMNSGKQKNKERSLYTLRFPSGERVTEDRRSVRRSTSGPVLNGIVVSIYILIIMIASSKSVLHDMFSENNI